MALSGIMFVTWRVVQFIFLIPLIGMLSWFVHGCELDPPAFLLPATVR